jgi:hypothetical protein
MSTLSAVSPVAAKVALTVELKEAREMAAFYRGRVQFLRAAVKEVRLDNKIARSAARDAKRAERVAKLEAKLLALKTGPVGTKARAAAKRPSKAVVRKA